MKSLVALLLTLTMLISPFAAQASDTAEQTSDSTESAGTESTGTESAKAESAGSEDGTDDAKEEEEPDCD